MTGKIEESSILVVDDSNSFRLVTDRILSREGYQVIHASDGKSALEELKRGTAVRLILLDLFMPNMDGLEFLKAKSGISKFKDIPVVMITTETNQEKIEIARNLGVKAWLIKPYQPEQLTAVIHKIL